MAEAAATNFYLHSGTYFIIQFNEATIPGDIPQTHNINMSSHQAIFAFIVAVLLNFLQAKYQGKDQSPFETHTKTMFAAILSLFLYCLSCDAMLKLSSRNNRLGTRTSPIYSRLVQISMSFFGPLSLAFISSTLFPESISPLLFSMSTLYSLCQIPRSHVVRIWNWLRAASVDYFSHQQGRRGTGLVSVNLPWFPEHPFVDEIDMLPLPPV